MNRTGNPMRRQMVLGGLAVGALFFAPRGSQAQASSAAIGVGVVRPLSGPLQSVAEGYLESVRAVVAAVNAEGGVAGSRIELIERDDQGIPERSVEHVKTLASQPEVLALLGLAGTGNVQAVSPLLQQGRLPLIGPFSGAASLRDAQHRMIFHVRASYDDELDTILDTMALRHASGRAVVLFQDDPFGTGSYGTLLRNASARAPQLRLSAYRFDRNTGALTDPDPAAAALKSADAVLLVAAPKAAAKLLTEVRVLNRATTVYTLSVVDALALVKAAGAAAASGVVIPQVLPNPRRSSLRLVSDYRALMEKRKQPLSYAGLEGYLAARVLVEGLQRVRGGPVTREKLVAALEGFGRLDLGGFQINYSSNSRAGSRFVDLSMISSSGSVID